jgi:hypothetical protein
VPRPAARTGIPLTGKAARPAIRIQAEPRFKDDLDATFLDHVQQEVKQGGIGWLVSLGVHLLLLAIFAIMVVVHEKQDDLSAMVGSWINPNDITRMKSEGKKKREAVQIEAVKLSPTPTVGAVTKRTPKDDSADKAAAAEAASIKPGDVAVGEVLKGREGDARDELLEKFGGTPQTETAVKLGLGWLKQQQKDDGHWEMQVEGVKDEKVSVKTDTGATALALLAFLGAGHTPQDGPYKATMRKGLDWLVKMQKANGDLHDSEEEGRQTSFYAHGQATIALCEAYAITRDPKLLGPTQKALDYIYKSQHPDRGGWKYRPNSDGDLSVFGWQLMAIQSARMAKLEVPSEVLDRAAGFLDLVQEQNGSRYRYEPEPNRPASPAMTAEGLLCRQYLGWQKSHPALLDGVSYLVQPDNLPSWTAGKRNVYYWYYATQVLHNMQGPAWDTWNNKLRDEIVRNQNKTGKLSGSWHPTQPKGDPFENADKAGRLYITAMCILTLEVYYRHMPLYR